MYTTFNIAPCYTVISVNTIYYNHIWNTTKQSNISWPSISSPNKTTEFPIYMWHHWCYSHWYIANQYN